jgi:hypothetical protein
MRVRLLAAASLLLAAACAAPPAARPVATPPVPSPPEEKKEPPKFLAPSPYAGGDGSTVDQAVQVLAVDDNEGARLENEWIFGRFGRFRKKFGALASAEGRHFDVIRFELPDGSEHTVYFDITGYYGAGAPGQ